jgi:periplasmic copper chaperone A
MKRLMFPLTAALMLTAASIVTAYACEKHQKASTGIMPSGDQTKAEVHLAAADMPAARQDTAAPVIAGDLEITQGWVRATLPGQPAAGGFLTIDNKGKEADRLMSIASPLTPSAQIHEMKMDGDVMKMAELADGLEIPAGGKVELKPGGLHLMFMGLQKQVMEGEAVKVTLTFEKAGAIEIELPVQPADAKQMQHQHGG